MAHIPFNSNVVAAFSPCLILGAILASLLLDLLCYPAFAVPMSGCLCTPSCFHGYDNSFIHSFIHSATGAREHIAARLLLWNV